MAELSFAEIFEIEIEGWRFGIESHSKDLSKKQIHDVIKEMAMVFEIAIQQGYPFDLVAIAKSFASASKNLVNPKEVAFYILSVIPHPSKFNDEEKKTLLQIINHVEHNFGGAKERLQKRWYQKSTEI